MFCENHLNFGSKRACSAIVGQRALQIALALETRAAIVESHDVFRIETDGLTEIRNGEVEILVRVISRATVLVHASLVRLVLCKPQGIAQVRDGALIVTLPDPGDAAVVVGVGELWIVADGLAIIGNGQIEISLAAPCQPTLVKCLRELGTLELAR
jgi:hypothetical protein